MKLVGKITEAERDEIMELNDRKMTVQDMLNNLNEVNAHLYQQLMKDLLDTNKAYQKWWDDNYKKYNWESAPNREWEINFSTCEIFLKNK